MEIVHQPTVIREDRRLLALTHLSQLLDYVTGFGGLVVPLVIWLLKKDEIIDMDTQGKGIINFQLSLLLYCFLSVPLILLFGLGILSIFVLAVLGFVLPIVNAIKVNNGEKPNYYISIHFLK